MGLFLLINNNANNILYTVVNLYCSFSIKAQGKCSTVHEKPHKVVTF